MESKVVVPAQGKKITLQTANSTFLKIRLSLTLKVMESV